MVMDADQEPIPQALSIEVGLETDLSDQPTAPQSSEQLIKFSTISQTIPFLALPAEVRNQIYHFVLYNPLAIRPQPRPPRSSTCPLLHDGHKEPKCSKSVPDRTWRWTPTCPSLLLLNHQIHHEAISILYPNTTFNFSSACAFECFLHQIGPVNTAQIRHLEIMCYMDEDYTDEDQAAWWFDEFVHNRPVNTYAWGEALCTSGLRNIETITMRANPWWVLMRGYLRLSHQHAIGVQDIFERARSAGTPGPMLYLGGYRGDEEDRLKKQFGIRTKVVDCLKPAIGSPQTRGMYRMRPRIVHPNFKKRFYGDRADPPVGQKELSVRHEVHDPFIFESDQVHRKYEYSS